MRKQNKQNVNFSITKKFTGLKHFKDFKDFIEYSNDMEDIYKSIKKKKSQNKKRKTFFFFDDMIADMLINKKLNLVVTELFIRGRKLNVSLVFIIQSFFAGPKNIRLNSRHYFIMKILSS